MNLKSRWIPQVALLALLCFGMDISGSSPISYEYYLLNPNITSADLSVISLSETNKIKSGTTELTLEKYTIGQIPVGTDLAQGAKISGTGPFTLGSEVDATDLPAPGIFAGTNFVIPHYRDNHTYYLLSPYGDATVTIAGVAEPIPLTQGVVVAFDAGSDNTKPGIVQSDRPILVSHVAGIGTVLDRDAYPVPPASLEAWGIRSSVVTIGALEAATVTVSYSDGTSENITLVAGGQATLGAAAIDNLDNNGQGPGLHIVATGLIAAIQSEDGDGVETTAFLDTPYFGTRYGIPVASQHIAVVCTKTGTIVTLKDGTKTPEVQTCGTTTPGKLYFTSPDAVSYAAGTNLESNDPIYVTYDTGTLGDEHNITGHKDSYFVMDTNTDDADMNVISLVNNNQINAGSTSLTLNEFEMGVLPATALSQGTEISGTGPFTLGSAVNMTDLPVPGVFAGTRFVIPHYRYTHYYFLLSPYGDTTATINIAGVEKSVDLLKGQVHLFNAGADNTVSGIVKSENPILVSHADSTNIYDAYPVPPASLEAWGVKSTVAYVGALENNTTITVYSSNDQSEVFVLNAGGKKEIAVGSNAYQGAGSALHIVADKPVAAIQSADSDGGEATAFFDAPYMGTRYAIPVDSQYIAVVCMANTTVSLQVDLTTAEMQSCTSDGITPGKLYFGSSANVMSYLAGAYLESTQPIYVIYEAAVMDDEHNLLGFNIARKAAPPALLVAVGGLIREADVAGYTVSGTAEPNETINIYLNGVLDQTVTASASGAYNNSTAFTFYDGENTIYTTVSNSESESLPSQILIVHYVPTGSVEYYVVDPATAANNLTLYSQVDGNTVHAGTTQYTLNDGETVTVSATDIAQGDVIFGSGKFSIGSYSKGGGNAVPESMLGTSFAMSLFGTVPHRYYIFSPEVDANVTVTFGAGGSSNITVLAGEVVTVDAGATNLVSDVVTSDVPVAVSYNQSSVYEYPVMPASLEVWGIKSAYAYVSATVDNTTVIVEASDGTSESFVINTGERKAITTGMGANHGQGSSLRISADQPITAIQVSDGDSNDATSFWPSSLHATHYTIPVDTQYVAIACSQPNTSISYIDSVTLVETLVTCNGSATTPGKAYLGQSTGTTIIAGSTIQASAPIYLYYEVGGANQTEQNLLGFNLGQLADGGTLSGDVGGMILSANTRYTVTADITVGAAQTLVINQGAELRFFSNAGLAINGSATLTINGTTLNPVVLTSDAITPAKFDWDGIIVNAGVTNVLIDHAAIEYATVGIFFNNSTGTITNSSLQNNWTAILTHDVNATPSITSSIVTANDIGLSVTGTAALGGNSNPVVIGNSIFDNLTMNYATSSFYSPATTNLNATGNWWGTTEPSVIADKIYDYVDVPLDSPTVTYSPFFSAAP